MEIERKFLVDLNKFDYTSYPFKLLEQGYLSENPVIRVRKEDECYYMTYKGKGLLAREEYNLPLTPESYEHMIKKSDGNIIRKKRYIIPYKNHTIELDVFDKPFAPLIMAEVEFESLEDAETFEAPDWFLEDVTSDTKYYNVNMSRQVF